MEFQPKLRQPFPELYEVSETLGLSRVETKDFLRRHHLPLAEIGEADLEREATLFDAASRPTLAGSRDESRFQHLTPALSDRRRT